MTNSFSKQISYDEYINYCIENDYDDYSHYDINIYDIKDKLYNDINNIIYDYYLQLDYTIYDNDK